MKQHGPFYLRVDANGEAKLTGWGAAHVSERIGSFVRARCEKDGGRFVQVMLVEIPSALPAVPQTPAHSDKA
jgi:hypothetical protein